MPFGQRDFGILHRDVMQEVEPLADAAAIGGLRQRADDGRYGYSKYPS